MLNEQQAQKLANFFKENIFPTLESHEEKLNEMYEIAKNINDSFEKRLKMADLNKVILEGTIMKKNKIEFKFQDKAIYSKTTIYSKIQKEAVLENQVISNIQVENSNQYINITNKILDTAS